MCSATYHHFYDIVSFSYICAFRGVMGFYSAWNSPVGTTHILLLSSNHHILLGTYLRKEQRQKQLLRAHGEYIFFFEKNTSDWHVKEFWYNEYHL